MFCFKIYNCKYFNPTTNMITITIYTILWLIKSTGLAITKDLSL
jgi:hypothetical protein